MNLAVCVGQPAVSVATRVEPTDLNLSLGDLAVRILELVLKIGICDLGLGQLHLRGLALSLEL